jgi:hypothetical protein
MLEVPLVGPSFFFQEMDHTGGTEFAVQLRILAFETRFAHINLMFFAFVATLFIGIFRAAVHFRAPSHCFSLLIPARAKGYRQPRSLHPKGDEV